MKKISILMTAVIMFLSLMLPFGSAFASSTYYKYADFDGYSVISGNYNIMLNGSGTVNFVEVVFEDGTKQTLKNSNQNLSFALSIVLDSSKKIDYVVVGHNTSVTLSSVQLKNSSNSTTYKLVTSFSTTPPVVIPEIDFLGGLLDNVVLNNGGYFGRTNSTTNNVTDNDVTTNVKLAKQLNYNDATDNDTLWFEFDGLTNITGYRLNSSHNVNLIAENDKEILIENVYASKNDGSLEPVSLEGVKRIGIENFFDFEIDINEFNVYGETEKTVVHDELSNLNMSATHESVSLAWNIPADNADFTGTKIYKNGSLLTSVDKNTNVYVDNNVQPNETYTYKVTGVYIDGHETTGLTNSVVTESMPNDGVSAGEVINVSYNVTSNSISLEFDNPTDEDFSKVNIYLNGVLHGTSTNGKYVISGLNAETTYSIKLTTLDFDLNESIGITNSIMTNSEVDLVAPDAPKGVKVTPASNGAIVSWNKNTEPDVKGYNVYVDGEKYNSTPISATSMQIIGLEIDSSYSVRVTAVDSSNNESAESSAVTFTTDADAMPMLSMGYDLADVAVSASSWFSSLWMIIAFACAIPLSFYIASRIKLLFLD